MAKNKAQIEQSVENLYLFQWNCLKRQTDYVKDAKSWNHLIKEETEIVEAGSFGVDSDNANSERYLKLVAEKASLQNKYGFSILPDPNELNAWRLMAIDKSPIKRIKQNPLEDFFTWSDITLKVNLTYDKELLVNEFSKFVDDAQQRKGSLLKRTPKISTESGKPKFLRYFAVYDFMTSSTTNNNKRIKHTYKMVVLKLKNDGWYKNLSQKDAETLARQDYQTASKLLGDVKKRIKKKTYVATFDLPSNIAKKVSQDQKDY